MIFISTTAYADHIIYDDFIVSGSTCLGNDCINNETFGFSTLILKENNLRLRFHDTSSVANFPSADWQLTANDTKNGEKNYFAIDSIDIPTDTATHLLKINPNGAVTMGINDTFVLSLTGDLSIKGTLSDSSDINLKENIKPIDTTKILQKISKLPISTWNYKDNIKKERHISSMAQDFYKAFEFGPDDRHIAPKDAAFIAIVGVKELIKRIDIRDNKIETLESRLQKLENIISKLTQGESKSPSRQK